MSSSGPPMDERTRALLDEVVGRAVPARQAPVEFAVVPPEPAVRVVGIPDTTSIPPAVMRCLDALALACRDAYGMGVEVEGPGGRETVLDALETIRRYFA